MSKRKNFAQIVLEIKLLLEKEEELSIRQISFKTKSQWRTVEKVLDLLKKLKIVEESENKENDVKSRLFRIRTK